MEKKIKVGLIQQSNTNDIHANMQQLKANIEDCASKGAQLVVLQELHNSLYFCQTEDTRLFDLAESIPGPSTRFFGDIARSLEIVLVTSLFEKRAPGLYHNMQSYSTQTGILPENTEKCIFPMTRHIMKNSISLREISVLSRYRHQ